MTRPHHRGASDGASDADQDDAHRGVTHAAEQRAAQKAKSKKIKIGVISGIIVVTAVVGPPLGKWLVDAINEVGATTVEQPAE